MPDNEHQWVKDGKFPTGAGGHICGHPGSLGGTCGLAPGHNGPHHPVHVIEQILRSGSERQS